MTGLRQTRLVALREIRERSRSAGFRAGLVVMLLVVVGMVVAPSLIGGSDGTRNVGLTGAAPEGLASAVRDQGDAAGISVRIHRYDDVAAGRSAVRQDDVDLLVIRGPRLEWQGRGDDELQAVVSGAVQLVTVRQRAAAADIAPADLSMLMAPVPIEKVEIGLVAGRGSDDETAALVMSALLLAAIFLYGNLVLTGVVEEKASRVVEVLLARVSPRSLLVGKVVGIGLLGFAQFLVTAVAAVVATLAVDSPDIPAVSGVVLTWVVVWFVLGFGLYAMAYGALGSLASRSEDAQSVAGPVGYVLVAAFWASFAAVSTNPESVWSRLLSLFPVSAPLAMPGRIALGAAPWWESIAAAILTLGAVAALAGFAGRVYANAILRTGPTLRLRDAWHGNAVRQPSTPAAQTEGSDTGSKSPGPEPVGRR